MSFNSSLLLLDRSAPQQVLEGRGGGGGGWWCGGSEFLRWRCSWSVVIPNYIVIEEKSRERLI